MMNRSQKMVVICKKGSPAANICPKCATNHNDLGQDGFRRCRMCGYKWKDKVLNNIDPQAIEVESPDLQSFMKGKS